MDLGPSMEGGWGAKISSALSLMQEEVERGSMVEQLRLAVDLAVYMIIWFARFMLVMLPGPLGGLLLAPFTVDNAGALGGKGKQGMLVRSRVQSRSPVGRALYQVLALVNDIPASSRKYEFARALVERIVEENRVHGEGMTVVTQAALGAGFRRTVLMLGRTLAQGQSRSLQEWGLPWSWIPLGNRLPVPAAVRTAGSWTVSLVQTIVAASSSPRAGKSGAEDSDMPEKLAQELLWISEKMVACGAVRDAALQWAMAGSLASLSLSAPANVQRSLVKVSVLLCKGVVECDIDDVPDDIKIKLLVLWLPLFCNASHGGDGPIFTSMEKANNEKMLEQLIRVLPQMDQEEVLSIWLQEFAFSPSDWPNLEPCFTGWCHASRKLAQLPSLEAQFLPAVKALPSSQIA